MKKIIVLMVALLFVFAAGFAANADCDVTITMGCYLEATDAATVSWFWGGPGNSLNDIHLTKSGIFVVKHNCTVTVGTGVWLGGDNKLGDSGGGQPILVSAVQIGWTAPIGSFGVDNYQVDFSNDFNPAQWYNYDAAAFAGDVVTYQMTFTSP